MDEEATNPSSPLGLGTQEPPPAAPTGHSRLLGLHAVAVANVFWGLYVPVSAAALYGWIRFGAVGLGQQAIHGMDWVIGLIPLGLLLAVGVTVGLYRRSDRARQLSLGLAGAAVAVYTLHLVAALLDPERSSVLPWIGLILLHAWPLWYLSRPHVRAAFGT